MHLPMSFDQRWSKQDISCLFFLYFLLHRELENVLESSRKRKKERDRDLESSRKRKRRELEWVYVCGGEKTREKKKEKKKKKRMDEIERKNNIKNKK